MIFALALGIVWTRQPLALPGLTAELPGRPSEVKNPGLVNAGLLLQSRKVMARFGTVGFEALGADVPNGATIDLGRGARAAAEAIVDQRHWMVKETASWPEKPGKRKYVAGVRAFEGKRRWLITTTAIQKGGRSWLVALYWPAMDPVAMRTAQRVQNSIR